MFGHLNIKTQFMFTYRISKVVLGLRIVTM